MDSKYYIVVTEWLYPTESGRDVITDFDTKDEALVKCFELCDDELDNYSQVCGDYLAPEQYKDVDGNDHERERTEPVSLAELAPLVLDGHKTNAASKRRIDLGVVEPSVLVDVSGVG